MQTTTYSRLLETWHRVTDEGADRTLTTVENGIPRMFAKFEPRSPPLISLAYEDLYEGARWRQMAGKAPMFTVTELFVSLPAGGEKEIRKFVEDKKARRREIENFVLTKKLWKIAINYKIPANSPMYERMVGPRTFLRLLREFREAMATKPKQIAIARDKRGLMIVTDQDAEKLLFWK